MSESVPIRSSRAAEPREDVARERRLHLIQLAIVVVAALAGITVVALTGRSLVAVDDRRDDQVQQLSALVRARDLLREQQVAFWESRAALNADVPRQVRAAVSIGAVTFAELARREGDLDAGGGDQRGAVRRTLVASRELAALVAARPDGIPLGSRRDRLALAESEAVIGRLEDGLDAWVRNERTEANDARTDAQSLTRRLVITMFALLAALAVASVGGWRLVEGHRRRATGGLDRRRRKRVAILDTMRDGMFALSPRGIVTEANEAFLAQVGRSREDVVGQASAANYWPADFQDTVAKAARDGLEGRSELETAFVSPDGSRRPVAATVATRRDAAGRAVGVVATTRDITERRRAADAMRFVGEERAALARLATAAATESPGEVFHLAAREASRLLGARTGVVVRFENRAGRVVGHMAAGTPPSEPIPLDGDSVASHVRRTGAPARVDDYQALRTAEPEAYGHVPADQASAAGAPIRARGRLWGVLVVADADPVPADAHYALGRMADVLGLVVSNAETTAELVGRAASDPLTGLPNHRTFQERLVVEVERARRHGRPLSVAVFDIDQFKEVNDAHGYQTGDAILAETARRLAEARRPGDLLARIGGEEFALLMPETEPDEAHVIVDHARAKVAAAPFRSVGHLTLSAGVCDLETAGGVHDLWRLVDGALYWAKIHGRDATCVYSPEVVQELSVEERAARLERDRAIAGLRGLARAVDARDASTSKHSERVADLAVLLARHRGWDDQRAAALREAAVLHDVGKIGLPDAILFKPGPLTTAERSVVEQHPDLGAEIVAGLLDDEQTAWIKHHHERMDGGGYPHRLAGAAIPEGARIIALAEAWDVMVSEKPYADPRTGESALAECRDRSGTQFDPVLVEALQALTHGAGLPSGVRDVPGAGSL